MKAFSSLIFTFHHRELSVQCLLFHFILCFGNAKLDYYHVVVSAYYKRHNNRCLARCTFSWYSCCWNAKILSIFLGFCTLYVQISEQYHDSQRAWR